MMMICTNVMQQIDDIVKSIMVDVNGTPERLFKAVYNHREPNITGYPAIIYYHDTIENEYYNAKQNFRVYKFKMFIIVGADRTTLANASGKILPNAMDYLIGAFDSQWALNSIDGQRVWLVINKGQSDVAQSEKGLEAYTELDIVVKFLTNN